MPQSATADHLVITCPFHEHIYIRELVWAKCDFHLLSNQWPRLEVGGWQRLGSGVGFMQTWWEG